MGAKGFGGIGRKEIDNKGAGGGVGFFAFFPIWFIFIIFILLIFWN